MVFGIDGSWLVAFHQLGFSEVGLDEIEVSGLSAQVSSQTQKFRGVNIFLGSRVDGVAVGAEDATFLDFFPDEVDGTEVDDHVADVGALFQWIQVIEIETYSVGGCNGAVTVGTLFGAAFEAVDFEPEFFHEFAAVVVTGGAQLADGRFLSAQESGTGQCGIKVWRLEGELSDFSAETGTVATHRIKEI